MRPPLFAAEYLQCLMDEPVDCIASMRPPLFAAEYGSASELITNLAHCFNEAAAVRGGIHDSG